MNPASITIGILLAIGVLTAVVCCLGVATVKNTYDRLHFMAPVSTVSITAILIAVVVQEGWGQATIKTVLILLALAITNSVLAHATARAARVRELGHWQPAPGEKIEGLEQIAGGRHKR